jgi:hypothetical protein
MGWPGFGGPWPGAVPYGAPVGPAMSREQELEALKDQAEGFKEALEGIKTRIEELESEAKQETG